ncbi:MULTISPECIES: NADPH-dependent FMN reductase [unclassified Spirosoma]|uniref:NADPH-dependent FMN reductase n=1 Tax=unclassified Spirosoma TaxID=2621999 RepID=UPI0009605238|nr:MULTISPECIES: NADPH-dependent FMN reductase [unclassified Spirosoma]MBN8826374.1 NAD(P)H-dependent oxidoreductase [Spirosoma sp.]OJW76112.1 MAG: flavoprotein [Spirosoma sp. 48-14]
MNILAISGSLRAASTNTSLLRAAAKLAPAGVTISLYDGLDDLPHFSPERDIDPAPESVSKLRNQLRQTDAVMICTPEYIHGMPGALKNMLDWLASSGEFVYKPVSVISAGPSASGGSRAHALLLHTMDVLTAHLPEGASLIVPSVKTRLNAGGEITDPILAQELQAAIASLVNAVQHPAATA